MNISKWLKDNLPKEFKKSKVTKGAYEAENFGIVKSIRIEKSDFLDGEDKWVIVLDVSVHDRYWPKDSDHAALLVVEASIVDGSIVLLDRWDQITHWELDDLDGLKHAIESIALPWLDWFCAPANIVDYFGELERLEASSKSSDGITKFGTVLSDKLINPPRTRKYFNGAAASIYNELGQYGQALECLERHKAFVMNDHPANCKVKELNDAFFERMEMIDKGIENLKSLVQSGAG